MKKMSSHIFLFARGTIGVARGTVFQEEIRRGAGFKTVFFVKEKLEGDTVERLVYQVHALVRSRSFVTPAEGLSQSTTERVPLAREHSSLPAPFWPWLPPSSRALRGSAAPPPLLRALSPTSHGSGNKKQAEKHGNNKQGGVIPR